MKIIFYQRSCSGCAKPRKLLGEHSISPEVLDVRKNPISTTDSIKLVRKLKTVYGVSGKKIVSYDLKKDKPSDDELKKLIIGREGKMRAPCLQVGEIFIGGFDETLYKKVLRI